MIGSMLSTILLVIGTIVRIIILVPIFIILLFVSMLTPTTVDTDISAYETYRQELSYAAEFMPALDALG